MRLLLATTALLLSFSLAEAATCFKISKPINQSRVQLVQQVQCCCRTFNGGQCCAMVSCCSGGFVPGCSCR